MKKIIIISLMILGGIFLVFSAQQDSIIFSHKFHLEDAGATCTTCHTMVLESTSSADKLTPTMETCYTCHDQDNTECTVCHTNPDEAGNYPKASNLKAQFSHKQHAKSEDDCLKCHAGIVRSEQAGAEGFIPGREVCSDCHGPADFREDNTKCQTCHGKDFSFKPADHNALWLKNHGVMSEVNENSCSHCHQNNYCTACHEGDNLDRLAHPLNFRNNHGILAKGNTDNCMTCHAEQAFCVDCHQTQLVMPRSHSYAGWTTGPGGGQHAREAMYDFDSCSSCHNDAFTDNVCLRCHQK